VAYFKLLNQNVPGRT